MLERKIAAHAHGTEGIKAAVRAEVDSIELGSLLDDEGAHLIARRGTFLTRGTAVPSRFDDSIDPPGRFQLEAAIQSVHVQRAVTGVRTGR